MKTGTFCLTRLVPAKVAAVKWLQTVCRSTDNTFSDIYLKNDQNYYSRMKCFFLYYEDSILLGIVSIFAPDPKEAELSCVVLPSARRRGIFNGLKALALEELKRYGYRKVLLVSEPTSDSAVGMIEKKMLKLDHSEYSMTYRGTESIKIEGPTGDELYNGNFDFEAAVPEDADEIIPISQASFPASYGETVERFDEVMEAADMRMQKLTLNGRVIGCANVEIGRTSLCIFGVAIDPEERGKGYGQVLMLLLLAHLRRTFPAHEITLQVSSVNSRAVHIYRKLGFEITAELDYHLVGLQE